MKRIKYCLDQDNDCHWYCMPVSKKEEWSKFLELNPDDEESWNVPEWAEPIDFPDFSFYLD